ncbi:hypothetical protein VTI74DRAFT_1077 [Chaetomium olivicolor]
MIMSTPTPNNLRPLRRRLRNPLTAGGTQLAKFTDDAQQGGGFCQFSITYDFPPPADKARWKTIDTLIGGCPASAAGNLPTTGHDGDDRADSAHYANDSGTECIGQFEFNKLGNLEVYMNYALASISGGAEDDAFFQDLPGMFLANVPGECATVMGIFNIPNPGTYCRVLEPLTEGGSGFYAESWGWKWQWEWECCQQWFVRCCAACCRLCCSGGVHRTFFLLNDADGSWCRRWSRCSNLLPLPLFLARLPALALAPVLALVRARAPASHAHLRGFKCLSLTSWGLCSNGCGLPQPVAAGTKCNGDKIVALERSAKFRRLLRLKLW